MELLTLENTNARTPAEFCADEQLSKLYRTGNLLQENETASNLRSNQQEDQQANQQEDQQANQENDQQDDQLDHQSSTSTQLHTANQNKRAYYDLSQPTENTGGNQNYKRGFNLNEFPPDENE